MTIFSGFGRFLSGWMTQSKAKRVECNQSEAVAHLQQWQQELQLQMSELQRPEYTSGNTEANLQADALIRLLHEHGIVVRSPQLSVNKQGGFRLEFTVLQALMLDHQMHYVSPALAYERTQALLPQLAAAVEEKATLQLELTPQQSLRIIAVPSQAAPEPELYRSDPQWLVDSVRSRCNFWISGSDGSGKSTLLDNVVGAMHQTWPDLVVLFSQPSMIDSEGWSGRSASCYLGMNQTFDLLSRLDTVINERLESARTPGYQPPVYPAGLACVNDLKAILTQAELDDSTMPFGCRHHVDWLIGHLRKALRLAPTMLSPSGQGLRLLYTSQTPFASHLKLRPAELVNSLCIFLGANIEQVLDRGLGNDLGSRRDGLRQRYRQLEAAGERYFCLVVPPRPSLPFLAKLPQPNCYPNVIKKAPLQTWSRGAV